ncbi:hypothetical protein RJ640_010979 [Escallonia rubra]|uniref:Protein FAR1-RELATED SEQUENCE n=1 Tax=Escallonia rubra TaxID=112253 RepID=A0AA88RJJ3_9ASTE|nr:hypothetical protein RJ640_010979 [Escallonia rubra]
MQRKKMPRVKVSCLPLLKQAGKVYTPKIFELFQRQWEKSLLALVGNKQERGRLQEYLIVSCDEDGEYAVTHDEENATLSCSCNKFETVGILCGHALKVLDLLRIKYIFETYSLDVSDRYRELWPDAVRLAHKASEFKDGYLFYKTRMKELDKEIEELRKKHDECTDHGYEPNGNKGVDKNAIESLVGNCLELPQVSTWSNFDHDNVEKDMYGPSFTEMLSAGFDDNLLSSLSQGSNRAQFNGKKVMGSSTCLVQTISNPEAKEAKEYLETSTCF